MHWTIAVVLVVLGLIFGSFINALVWRMYEQDKKQKAKSKKLSILRGRSMCPNCRHELSVGDLVPVFSWLVLGGRCRYCLKPISWQYPLVEITMAAIFVISYLLWPVSLHGAGQWLLFITWLASAVGLLALAVYDFRWMLLPSRILYPTFFVALTGRLGYIVFFADDKTSSFQLLASSFLVASGIFLLLYIFSQGRWIGFGDVRLGLITGTLLANPTNALLMIMLASMLGTLFVLPALLSGKRNAASKIPYGPFLIAATAVVLLLGDNISDWYRGLLT